MNILNDTWVFKIKTTQDFSKEQKKDDWLKSYKNVMKNINDIETFWGTWNNVLGRNKGKFNGKKLHCTVHSLFKDGIEPIWEDPKNKNGCSMHFFTESASKFADNVALMCIGNTINNSEYINGCTFDIKPPRMHHHSKKPTNKWKITIWLCENKNKLILIDDIKSFLISEMPENKEIIDNCRIDEHNM